MIRRMISGIVALAAATTMALTSQGAVSASPAEKIVTPSAAACANPSGIEQLASCGAAATEAWLAHVGYSGVVRKTVLLPVGSVDLFFDRLLRVCGYIELEEFSLGLHNCGGVTYVSAHHDMNLIKNPARALALFIHEATHAVQERNGLAPSTATIEQYGRSFFGIKLRPESPLLPFEHSADCASGDGIRFFESHPVFRQYTSVSEAATMWATISDESDEGHGGPGRVQEFWNGYNNGIEACNAYTSGRPLFN